MAEVAGSSFHHLGYEEPEIPIGADGTGAPVPPSGQGTPRQILFRTGGDQFLVVTSRGVVTLWDAAMLTALW